MENLSLHIRNFNDKVKAMNQLQKKELILSAADARNLHADIFELLTHLAELSGSNTAKTQDVVSINMDGGSY